jgi:hypothetical protein
VVERAAREVARVDIGERESQRVDRLAQEWNVPFLEPDRWNAEIIVRAVEV